MENAIKGGKEQLTKWGLAAGLGVLVLFLFGNTLFALAKTALGLAIVGVILIVLFFLLPAIGEYAANLGWQLYEDAIRRAPIARLKRDLQAHAKATDDLEQNIQEVMGQTNKVKKMIRDQKAHLTPDEVKEWEEQLVWLEQGGRELLDLRNERIQEHAEFERIINKAEAQYAIGNAFKSAFQGLSHAQKDGPGSQGAKIALDEVAKRLSEAQARMTIVLSRPKTKKPLASGEPATA